MVLPKNERVSNDTQTKRKIWIYGSPFSGKTYLANQFPDILLLSTDGNYTQLPNGIPPHIDIKDEITVEGRMTKRKFAWDVLKETISELEKKQNDFKTIIVDLLEDTYEYCRLYMYDKLGIEHESDDSFRAWDKVRTEYLSTIKRLMNLDYENIILISHEDSSKDLTKKSGDKITSIKPNINDKCATKVAGMVDLVARIIAEDNKRVISFKTSEVIFGGGRLNVSVNEIPCDYDDLMKVYNEANRSKTPVKTEPVNEQVSEQVNELGNPVGTRAVETATAEPVATETAEAPKTRTRKKREVVEEVAENSAENSAENAEVGEVGEVAEDVENPVEKTETPTRKRRKRTEE